MFRLLFLKALVLLVALASLAMTIETADAASCPRGYFYSRGTKGEGCKKTEKDKSVSWHGSFKSRYDSGALESKGRFKYGKKIGEWREYFPSEKIRKLTFYKDGVADGDFEEYHRNGELLAKGQYANGVQIGVWRFFFVSGTKKAKIVYDLAGLRDGKVYSWYDNKQRRSRTNWKAGVLHGLRELWSREGSKLQEANFEQGKKAGRFRRWVDGSTLLEEAFYVDGQYEGERQIWYDDGSPKFRGSYVAGKLQGKVQYWSSTGAERYLLAYEEGVVKEVLSGRVRYWLDNLRGKVELFQR